MKVDNENSFEKQKLLELRSNIIKWYDFNRDGNVLVIGDITGGITEFLASKVKNITVVVKDNIKQDDDLVEVALKHDNVTVINDEFANTKFNQKFDYIIMLEGLQFDNQDNENIEFMKKVKELLIENGTILLLINNPISLKFLSELNNDSYKIQGLSKERLENILNDANLKKYKFYYPLSDYNVTNVIFTDKLIPNSIDLERNMDLKEIVEKKKFDDRRILAQISEKSKIDFENYCNSFLVEISDGQINENVKAIYYNNIRKKEYRLVTKVLEREVFKYSVNEESKQHLKNITENIKILENCGINCLDTFDDEKIISKYVENPITLQDLFLKYFRENKTVDLLKLVEKYKNEILLKLGVTDSQNNIFEKYNVAISQEKIEKMTFLKNGLYDLNFQNIFIINNKYYVYDQEWKEKNVPVEFILYRSIRYMPNVLDDKKTNLYQLFKIDEFVDEFIQLEENLQNRILDKDLHLLCLNNFKSYDCMDSNKEKQLYEQLEKKNDEEIEQYKKELVFKQGMLDSKEMMSAYLATQVDDFSTAYFTVSDELAKMQKELELKNQEVSSVYQSEQYQKGAIALKKEKDWYPILVTVRGIKKVTKKIFRPIKKRNFIGN